MTAAVLIGIVALICLTATAVSVAVTSRRSVSDAFRALELNESRNQKHLDSVLDRLMTIKWEDYATVRSVVDDEEVGGFIPPNSSGDDEDELVVDDGKWGRLSTLRERLRLTDEEAALIDEDFDETGSPRRAS